MSFTRPRSLLDPDDVGVLILPDLPKGMTDKLNVLRTSQIDCFDIDSVNQPAWTDPKLWALSSTSGLVCARLLAALSLIVRHSRQMRLISWVMAQLRLWGFLHLAGQRLRGRVWRLSKVFFSDC